MDVSFTVEQESQLSAIASREGLETTSQLVHDTVLRLVQDDAEFRQGVRRGIAQADRGELIGHEDVKRRLASLPGGR